MAQTLSVADYTLLIDALALAASRRESQARRNKFGAKNDEEAAAMRELRVRMMRERMTRVEHDLGVAKLRASVTP